MGTKTGGARNRSMPPYRQRESSHVLSLSGFLLLASAKAIDIQTTVIGLALSARLVETNGIARRAMHAWGTAEGLVFLGGLLVLGTTLVIEWAAYTVGRRSPAFVLPEVIRGVGYGSLSAVYLGAAYRNTRLIVETTHIESILSIVV